MVFHGALGDEQGLGDLPVRPAGRGELGDAQLARRETWASSIRSAASRRADSLSPAARRHIAADDRQGIAAGLWMPYRMANSPAAISRTEPALARASSIAAFIAATSWLRSRSKSEVDPEAHAW